jgi:hypothetical protein
MSVLSQTTMCLNIPYWKPLLWEQTLYSIKKEMDELYLDYNDKNADRIGNCRFSLKK